MSKKNVITTVVSIVVIAALIVATVFIVNKMNNDKINQEMADSYSNLSQTVQKFVDVRDGTEMVISNGKNSGYTSDTLTDLENNISNGDKIIENIVTNHPIVVNDGTYTVDENKVNNSDYTEEQVSEVNKINSELSTITENVENGSDEVSRQIQEFTINNAKKNLNEVLVTAKKKIDEAKKIVTEKKNKVGKSDTINTLNNRVKDLEVLVNKDFESFVNVNEYNAHADLITKGADSVSAAINDVNKAVEAEAKRVAEAAAAAKAAAEKKSSIVKENNVNNKTNSKVEAEKKSVVKKSPNNEKKKTTAKNIETKKVEKKNSTKKSETKKNTTKKNSGSTQKKSSKNNNSGGSGSNPTVKELEDAWGKMIKDGMDKSQCGKKIIVDGRETTITC